MSPAQRAEIPALSALRMLVHEIRPFIVSFFPAGCAQFPVCGDKADDTRDNEARKQQPDLDAV
jgi:hypothetical protein